MAHTVVLDPLRHARLLADLEHVCEVANVPQSFIRQSMQGYCSEEEIDWVRSFHAHRDAGVGGLALVGVKSAEVRCMAIAGALIRNFIDARIVPLNTLLELKEEARTPDPTVLLVPNLFLSSAGRSLPAWKIQTLYDVLLGRLTASKPTVVYVEDLDGLGGAYGPVFVEHLQTHFRMVTT